MSDWSEGYVTEIGYTYGYYQELNPLRMRWALLSAGYDAPAAGAGGYTVCELGFGQGLSLNIHAAAQSGDWWGTDFNPAQVAFAQKLADASGAPLHLYEDSFSDFAQRPELPAFDVIALHGIWTWVSEENRRVIVDFIRRKLKVGGLVYVSYNTLPGWSTGMPLRELMTQHARSSAAPGQGMVQKVDAAIEFTERLAATNPLALRANPHFVERLKQLKTQNRQYLAHEYFNREWHPMYFADMAQWLAGAKLSFAASSSVLDHVRALNVTAEQGKLLDGVQDPVFRETVRDYCVNQQFRRDLWLRGAVPLHPAEAAEALRAWSVVLLQPADEVKLSVTGPLGETQIKPEVAQPVLAELAAHQPLTVGELERRLGGKVQWSALREVLNLLVGANAIAPALPPEQARARKATSDRLNAFVLQQARTRKEVGCMASPVLGGGVPVPRLEQIFLAARAGGAAEPRQWADAVWSVLAAGNERVVKDGKPLATPEENRAELLAQAERFRAKRLPILQSLGVA